MQPASSGPSCTASMVAAYRARASRSKGGLCDDPWADALAGDVGARMMEEFDVLVPFMELLVAVRTAFLDEQVRDWATADNALDFGRINNQVVIVGAGLDSRAARLGRSGLNFYEIDHPGSLQFKQDRVRALDGYSDEAVTYVPCDLEQSDLLDALAPTSFAPRQPALFLCEGLVPYLSEDAVRRMFSGIATRCDERSVVVFDHAVSAAVERRASPQEQRIEERMESLGEPLRFGRGDVRRLLSDAGFRHLRSVGLEAVRERLTGHSDPAAPLRFQQVTIASRDGHPGGHA